MTTETMPAPSVTRWLSVPRFTPYLTEASGNERHALRSYAWNRTP